MTTINATQDDLRNIAEVLKLAAILDDRAPGADKPRIALWAEQIHRHHLTREDLLDGLQAFYDEPHERSIGIGDLITRGRAAKRSRLEREDDDDRDGRRDALDVKAVDDMRALAAGAVMGPTTNKTDRLAKAEIALQCCTGETEAQAAIREYFAAKTKAKKQAAK